MKQSIKICFIFVLILASIHSSAATSTLISGVVNFDSETNLSTLLTSVNNVSQMSESGGIYTMHVPFYQNSSSNGFTIDTILHLNSTSGTIAYYRWANTTITGATILGWNTTSDTTAPKTDATRTYIYLDSGAVGDVTNSNISYLGYDDSHPGIHFVDYTNANINGNTFIDNYRGIIITSSGGNTVNNNIITNSVDNGISILGGTLDSMNNNTITSPGRYGYLIENAISPTVTNSTITNAGSYGVLTSTVSNLTFTNNDISGSALSGVWTSVMTASHFSNNRIYDSGESGYDIKYSSSGNTFTNETVYNNTKYGFIITSNSNTFVSCNVSDSNGSFYDYYLDSGTSLKIIDNVNRSNIIKSDVTFQIQYTTGTEYNTTYTLLNAYSLVDHALIGTEFYNTSVLSGSVTPSGLTGLPASRKFVLVYYNGTVIEKATSDASGNLVFTTSLATGDYRVIYGYDNFSFTEASVSPASITTVESSIIRIVISDYDGSIDLVYANVGGTNYTMINNSWTYSFSSSTTGVYSIIFYAQDNHGYWNSTDSSLTITVTSIPVIVPPPVHHDPTPTPTPTANATATPKPPIIPPIVPPTAEDVTTFFMATITFLFLIMFSYIGSATSSYVIEEKVETAGILLYGTVAWISLLLVNIFVSLPFDSIPISMIIFFVAGLAVFAIMHKKSNVSVPRGIRRR